MCEFISILLNSSKINYSQMNEEQKKAIRELICKVCGNKCKD